MSEAKSGFFVTGTDTSIGKTWVSLGLMAALQARGIQVTAMKPVASGCEKRNGQWENSDAIALSAQSSLDFAYPVVNPYAFEPAIAPHLAADEAGSHIDLQLIKQNYRTLSQDADVTIVEGAGGWLVPLAEETAMCDIPSTLGLRVILVVGMRLGCINHALLSVESIRAHGLPLAGWVGNCVEPEMDRMEQNMDSLRRRIQAPCLGLVPHQPMAAPEQTAKYLSTKPLLAACRT